MRATGTTRACWVLALLVACGPTGAHARCCDATNVDNVAEDGDTFNGLKIPRFEANASNTAKCPDMYQCVTCDIGGYNIKSILPECEDCEGSGLSGTCVQCLLGDYCPEGTVNIAAHTGQVLCPDGKVCTPDPQGWSSATGYSYEYEMTDCPSGHTCPAGTSRPLSESNGTDCQVMMEKYLEDQGHVVPPGSPTGVYCKTGTSPYDYMVMNMETIMPYCKKGTYCPNSTTAIECPEGHFCRGRIAEPSKCSNVGSNMCATTGVEAPPIDKLRVFMVVVGFLLVYVTGFQLNARMRRVAQANKQRHQLRLAVTGGVDKLTKTVLRDLPISFGGTTNIFAKAKQPISIEFHKLGLLVGERRVLNAVSGLFAHSRLIAVMGPSGCGKSTLMNTLCGRASYGTTEGSILINGLEQPVKCLQSVMGFVPQDDTVFGDLTVFENIRYSERLRASATRSEQQQTKMTQGVVEMLGLSHIQDSLVGTVEKRGISGGQKKRVNIGMELAADPTILFMDEPTSGLAATDTLTIIQSLHNFVKARRTVVAVIHQPRYLAFMLFHDLMLLYPGGYAVFFGKTSMAEPYFSALGFDHPKGENPADFFLDVISGTFNHPTDSGFKAFDLCNIWETEVRWSRDATDCIKEFIARRVASKDTEKLSNVPTADHEAPASPASPASPAKARSKGKRGARSALAGAKQSVSYENPMLQMAHDRIKAAYERIDVARDGSISTKELWDYLVETLKVDSSLADKVCNEIDADGNGDVSMEEFMALFESELNSLQVADEVTEDNSAQGQREVEKRKKIPMWKSFAILVRRTIQQKLRLMDVLLVNLIMMMVSGTMVGLLLGSDYQPFDITDTRMTLMMTLIMTIIVTLSAVNSLNLFGYSAVMIDREAHSGVPMLAMFCAKVLVDLLENIWQPIFFLGVCYNIVFPRETFAAMLGSLILLSFVGSGIGILLSMLVKPQSMTLVTVLICLVSGIFINGTIGLTAKQVHSKNLDGLWAMSYARWGQELLLVGELQAHSHEAYQQLIVQEAVLFYGFFPRGQTKSDWESGKSMQERIADWDEYFSDYGSRCRTNIVIIGIVLRAVAYLVMRYTKDLKLLKAALKERLAPKQRDEREEQPVPAAAPADEAAAEMDEVKLSVSDETPAV